MATWAKENLEPDKLLSSPVHQFLRKISTEKEEKKVYAEELRHCTHVIQAVGFKADATVKLLTGKGKPLYKEFDHTKGNFTDKEREEIRGLFGAGIAYPEKVVDPEGNVEFAVGLFKFTNFLRRVVPTWNLNGNRDLKNTVKHSILQDVQEK